MGIVNIKNLIHDYRDEEENETVRAIDNVSLQIEAGQFIVILGHNGSGKSSLAKHINALLMPTEGTVWVDGIETTNNKRIWDIRQTAGMVFQNPDNQIVATMVEEDVAFGPENMAVPTDEIWRRVEKALGAVNDCIQTQVSVETFRRTKTESRNSRHHCHGTKMHCT